VPPYRTTPKRSRHAPCYNRVDLLSPTELCIFGDCQLEYSSFTRMKLFGYCRLFFCLEKKDSRHQKN